MFVLRPFNFWLMMSFSTSLLAMLSFIFGRPLFRREDMNWQNLLLGVVSAGVLYTIFRVGNELLILASQLFPDFLTNPVENIKSVYENKGSLSPTLVGALLFFPIGFGEEIFWRGFIQGRLTQRWDAPRALVLTTFIYTCVHIPTGNPVLILAALTAGLFWGGLYWYKGSITPVLISHMLWDPLIFVVWPIR
jgi:membrane protease YdiL (CAAX protease family)